MPMSLSKPSMLGLNLDIIMETIARLAASDAVSLLKTSRDLYFEPLLWTTLIRREYEHAPNSMLDVEGATFEHQRRAFLRAASILHNLSLPNPLYCSVAYLQLGEQDSIIHVIEGQQLLLTVREVPAIFKCWDFASMQLVGEFRHADGLVARWTVGRNYQQTNPSLRQYLMAVSSATTKIAVLQVDYSDRKRVTFTEAAQYSVEFNHPEFEGILLTDESIHFIHSVPRASYGTCPLAHDPDLPVQKLDLHPLHLDRDDLDFVRPQILSIKDNRAVTAVYITTGRPYDYNPRMHHLAFEPSRNQSCIIPTLRHQLPFVPAGLIATAFPDCRSTNLVGSLLPLESTPEDRGRRTYTLWSLLETESPSISSPSLECKRVGSYIYDCAEYWEIPSISTFGHKMLVMARGNSSDARPVPELVDLRPRFDESCVMSRLSLPADIDGRWLGQRSRSIWVFGAMFGMDFELGKLLLLGPDGKLAIVQY